MPLDECLELLRDASVGRVAVVINEFPVVIPVNYTFIEAAGRRWFALRTPPGSTIDLAPIPVALEIDGIDAAGHQSWSVLVRGTLHHVDPDTADFRERFDPEPWSETVDVLLVVVPFAITGRRLHAAQLPFDPTVFV
jgi:nitroimidazol reductase NimA-like FMN-containing flavoprotein (pyridoxamine 5'-phosphate oxidase superfamily)